MSLDGAQIIQPDDFLGRMYRAIVAGSQYIVYIAIILMMIVMGLEVFMRYIITEPLGWNISLVENILMPGLVFLGLPWAYAVSAHVAAGMIYDRLSGATQMVLDWIARLLIISCALFLIYAGTLITIDAFSLGSSPPPLSAQVGVPTWMWRSFLPLGTAMMLLLMLIDLGRLGTKNRTAT